MLHELEEREQSLTHGLSKEIAPRIQGEKLKVLSPRQETPSKNTDVESEGNLRIYFQNDV